jgi:hypothetical protein
MRADQSVFSGNPHETLPCNDELLGVAERTVWYKTPAEAVADPLNFVAHVLTYGTHEDVKTLRRYLDLDDIRDALDHAPPGVFDGPLMVLLERHGRAVSHAPAAKTRHPGLTRHHAPAAVALAGCGVGVDASVAAAMIRTPCPCVGSAQPIWPARTGV